MRASFGLRGLFVAGLVVFGVCEESRAQDAFKIEIGKVSCRDMLLMNDDQEFTLVFLHGFMSGKKNETVYDDKNLTEATDKIVEYCVDNPNDALLGVFEKFR